MEYIEREALLKRFEAHLATNPSTIGKKRFAEGYYLGLSEAEIMVSQAKAADVAEVRRGRWIRLIDANALPRRTWLDGTVLAMAVQEVDKAPAIDAENVVRCKDCKHYCNYGRTSLLVDGKNIKAGWCHRRIRYDEEFRMLPDDFCSYGEKREVE